MKVSERAKGVCATCGRIAYCDAHHVLGRAHVPDVTVPACVRTCHPVLNERQAIAEMVRDHGSRRGEGEAFWAFASGLGDVLFVRGFSSARIKEGELQRQEAAITTLGRMVDLVYRAAGEIGIAGPNPRKTDLRVAGRRRSRNPDRSRPNQRPPAPDPATDFEPSDQLARCVRGAIASLPRSDLFGDIVEAWGLLVARLPNVSLRLHELAVRGREADLFEGLREGTRRLDEGIAAFARVERIEDFAAAWPYTARFAAFFSSASAFLRDLAAAETADQGEAALDRLRTAVYAA